MIYHSPRQSLPIPSSIRSGPLASRKHKHFNRRGAAYVITGEGGRRRPRRREPGRKCGIEDVPLVTADGLQVASAHTPTGGNSGRLSVFCGKGDVGADGLLFSKKVPQLRHAPEMNANLQTGVSSSGCPPLESAEALVATSVGSGKWVQWRCPTLMPPYHSTALPSPRHISVFSTALHSNHRIRLQPQARGALLLRATRQCHPCTWVSVQHTRMPPSRQAQPRPRRAARRGKPGPPHSANTTLKRRLG
jgi:hypothetical protein